MEILKPIIQEDSFYNSIIRYYFFDMFSFSLLSFR